MSGRPKSLADEDDGKDIIRKMNNSVGVRWRTTGFVFGFAIEGSKMNAFCAVLVLDEFWRVIRMRLQRELCVRRRGEGLWGGDYHKQITAQHRPSKT